MRAKKFYNLLKEEQDDSVLTVCFDLMQTRPQPKSSIDEVLFQAVVIIFPGCACLPSWRARQKRRIILYVR